MKVVRRSSGSIARWIIMRIIRTSSSNSRIHDGCIHQTQKGDETKGNERWDVEEKKSSFFFKKKKKKEIMFFFFFFKKKKKKNNFLFL